MDAGGQAAVGQHGVGVGAAAAIHVDGIAHHRAGGVVHAVAQANQGGHMVNDQLVVATGQSVGVAEHAHMAADGLRTQGDHVALPLASQLNLVRREAAFHEQGGAHGIHVASVTNAAVYREVPSR